MKKRFLRIFVKRFDSLSVDIYRMFITIFNDDNTYADIEYKIRFKSSYKGKTITRDVAIHIRSRNMRTSEEMDTETRKWFNSIVKKIQSFDTFVKNKLLEG